MYTGTGCFKYYIGETGNLRLRTNLHRDHTKKNEGLGVNKHIFHCTVGKSIERAFRIMPIYKVKEDDTDLKRNMEEYVLNKWRANIQSGLTHKKLKITPVIGKVG